MANGEHSRNILLACDGTRDPPPVAHRKSAPDRPRRPGQGLAPCDERRTRGHGPVAGSAIYSRGVTRRYGTAGERAGGGGGGEQCALVVGAPRRAANERKPLTLVLLVNSPATQELPGTSPADAGPRKPSALSMKVVVVYAGTAGCRRSAFSAERPVKNETRVGPHWATNQKY